MKNGWMNWSACWAAAETTHARWPRPCGVNPRSLRELNTTHRELKLIAPAAIMGFSVRPKAGYKHPAANGMPMML